jgi:hypothetical protein
MHHEAEQATRADAAEAKVAELETKVITLSKEKDNLVHLIAEAEAEINRQDAEATDLWNRLAKVTRAKDNVIREAKRQADGPGPRTWPGYFMGVSLTYASWANTRLQLRDTDRE